MLLYVFYKTIWHKSFIPIRQTKNGQNQVPKQIMLTNILQCEIETSVQIETFY